MAFSLFTEGMTARRTSGEVEIAESALSNAAR
jgi:hypothetical protein